MKLWSGWEWFCKQTGAEHSDESPGDDTHDGGDRGDDDEGSVSFLFIFREYWTRRMLMETAR